MKFSEHKFDRLDESFAQKSISQLIDDSMRPNWGTRSPNPEFIYKFISSKSLSHFQFLKMKFPGPKFYSFDLISHPHPIMN